MLLREAAHLNSTGLMIMVKMWCCLSLLWLAHTCRWIWTRTWRRLLARTTQCWPALQRLSPWHRYGGESSEAGVVYGSGKLARWINASVATRVIKTLSLISTFLFHFIRRRWWAQQTIRHSSVTSTFRSAPPAGPAEPQPQLEHEAAAREHNDHNLGGGHGRQRRRQQL